VFLAEAPGVHLEGGGTPEAWAQQVDQLFEVDGFGIPPNMLDEVVFSVQQIAGLTAGTMSTMSSNDWSTRRAGV
jgi:hypothetical protein